jgi:hypothetical protein
MSCVISFCFFNLVLKYFSSDLGLTEDQLILIYSEGWDYMKRDRNEKTSNMKGVSRVSQNMHIGTWTSTIT